MVLLALRIGQIGPVRQKWAELRVPTGVYGDVVMDVLYSVVEWFNGLVGLEYAGYGPITAIGIGIMTVLISIRILKYFLKPFAPLFLDDDGLGQPNPVLAQQGIRHSQMMDQSDTRERSGLIERSRDRAGRARKHFRRSRDDEDFEMDDEDVFQEGAKLTAANDSEAEDFADALEDAWQDDQSSELQAEIAPLRPMPSRKKLGLARKLRPTAAAAPLTKASTQQSTSKPVIRISNFNASSRSSGAANRMAIRFTKGISETLARIPNLAVENSNSGSHAATSDMVFTVDGNIELRSDGIHVSLAVRDPADGSHLMAREMTCSPAQMQGFEKEVALEIAAAVIANQRAPGLQSAHTPRVTDPVSKLTSGQDEQSEKKYPSARRPLLGRLRRTDQPMQ